MKFRTCMALLCGTALLGCNSSEAPEQKAAADAPPYRHQATLAELMSRVFDMQADVVWAVGGTIWTPESETRIVPKNDEEWNAVRNAATVVAEAGNLLMMEGRARDQGDWIKMSRAMIDKANECVQAADAKDVDAVFTAGGDLYIACTACHAKYVIGEELKSEDQPK